MTSYTRAKRLSALALALLAVAMLALTLVGCGDKPAEEPAAAASTAKASFEIARSSLETTAPDAKLLVVQTAQSTTPTSSPVWAYLFGSPKTSKTYLVYVADGKSMGASEYGTADLTEKDWAQVPDTTSWKTDSDAAYKAALEVSGASGAPASYSMGFQTFVPPGAGADAGDAFVWYVVFEPGASDATTATVEVDVETGKATVAK